MGHIFMGYRRPDGAVGTRNYLTVIPSVFCANTTAQKIAAQIPGAVALTHCVGCAQVGGGSGADSTHIESDGMPSQCWRGFGHWPWLRAL